MKNIQNNQSVNADASQENKQHFKNVMWQGVFAAMLVMFFTLSTILSAQAGSDDADTRNQSEYASPLYTGTIVKSEPAVPFKIDKYVRKGTKAQIDYEFEHYISPDLTLEGSGQVNLTCSDPE